MIVTLQGITINDSNIVSNYIILPITFMSFVLMAQVTTKNC